MIQASAASGIVLAGGASSRFGRDKLMEDVGGEPMLHRAIGALGQVCTEVLVAVGPELPSPALPSIGLPVRVVRDGVLQGGPLHGILAGLEQAAEPVVLVAAGDMPSLRPAVLGLLLRRLDREDVDGAVLAYRGKAEPLPCAVRDGAALVVARRLVAEGEGSVRAMLDGLRVAALEEADWRPLDPTAATLRDVDEPGDLRRL